MKDYQVKKDNELGYMIYSTSEHNPTDCISKIEKELIKKSYKGNVFFDLLLSNGNNFNRYLKAYFDGNNFQKDSYVIIAEPQIELKKKSVEFYQRNIELLENSILSKPIKFMIKKGHAI
ncbi:MAG: type II toxin-antitoxin system RnlB family antitoxin [Sulfuricurvum sp.]|nr:type II toxin-antitoxin system RnlB family antitoxin [Sulfuricurvum sp.]